MHPPAGAVNQALWMLDAHTDGKRFGLHGHLMAVQHGEGVAGAVAQRHHHLLGGQGIALPRVLFQDVQGLQLPLLVIGDVDHALFKPHFAA